MVRFLVQEVKYVDHYVEASNADVAFRHVDSLHANETLIPEELEEGDSDDGVVWSVVDDNGKLVGRRCDIDALDDAINLDNS